MNASPTSKPKTPVPLFIIARFHAREGCEEEVGALLLQQVQYVRREPGCTNIDVYRSTRIPRLHFLYSQWADDTAFNGHAESENTIAFIARVEPFLDHTLDVTRARRLTVEMVTELAS